MADQLLTLSALLWVIAAIVALCQGTAMSRVLLVAGALSGIVAAVFELPDPTQTIVLPFDLRARRSHFGWSLKRFG